MALSYFVILLFCRPSLFARKIPGWQGLAMEFALWVWNSPGARKFPEMGEIVMDILNVLRGSVWGCVLLVALMIAVGG